MRARPSSSSASTLNIALKPLPKPHNAPIPISKFTPKPLLASAPEYSSYLIIHVPIHPKHWPAKIDSSVFPLLKPLEDLSRAAGNTTSNLLLAGTKNSAIGDEIGKLNGFETGIRIAWDNGRDLGGGLGVQEQVDSFKKLSGKKVLARAFLAGRKSSVDVILPTSPRSKDLWMESEVIERDSDAQQYDIYVCTHGSRDCRCKDEGNPLIEKLELEIKHRNLEDKVKVWNISHLGGHHWAANALLFPPQTLLGNLTTTTAPFILSSILSEPHIPLWNYWRGQIGLSKQQAKLIGEAGIQHLNTLHSSPLDDEFEPTVLVRPTGAGKDFEAGLDYEEWKKRNDEFRKSDLVTPTPSPTIPTVGSDSKSADITFKTWEGEEITVTGQVGETLMELAKRHELPSVEGACGGVLECATCHMFPIGGETLPSFLSEISEEEEDMLGYAIGRKDTSRLGCQLQVSKELETWSKSGGRIGLPQY